MVVDRLEVDLPREEEVRVVERVRLECPPQRQPHRVLDEARVRVRLLDDVELVRPLEQPVNRGAHRVLDDLDELLGVDRLLGADVERSPPPLVVGRERNELEDPLDLVVLETGGLEPLARALPDEPLRAGAGVDSRRLDADDPASCPLRGGREPDQRNELLGPETGHGRPPLERILGDDLDLGAQRALAFDDLRGDAGGELLDQERFLDHDLLDRLLEQLREARHVHALLRRIEIDGAIDVRGDQLLVLAIADPDRLADAADAGAREPNLHVRGRSL